MAQIVDISRIISLEQIEEEAPEAREGSVSAGTKQEGQESADQIVESSLAEPPVKDKQNVRKNLEIQLRPGPHQTSGTATLNVLQVQRAVFDEQRLSQQIQHIMKKLMECKAIRHAQHVKSKEQAEAFDDSKSDKSIKITEPVEQKDSLQDFKKFVADF